MRLDRKGGQIEDQSWVWGVEVTIYSLYPMISTETGVRVNPKHIPLAKTLFSIADFSDFHSRRLLFSIADFSASPIFRCDMAITVYEFEKAMTELGAVFDTLWAQFDDDPDQEMKNAGNRLGDLDSAIEAYQMLRDLSIDLGKIRPHLKDIMDLLEYIPSEGNYGSIKARIIAICTRTLAKLEDEPVGAAENPDAGAADNPNNDDDTPTPANDGANNDAPVPAVNPA